MRTHGICSRVQFTLMILGTAYVCLQLRLYCMFVLTSRTDASTPGDDKTSSTAAFPSSEILTQAEKGWCVELTAEAQIVNGSPRHPVSGVTGAEGTCRFNILHRFTSESNYLKGLRLANGRRTKYDALYIQIV